MAVAKTKTPSRFRFAETIAYPEAEKRAATGESYLLRIQPPGILDNLIPLRAGFTTLGRDECCDIEVVDDFTSREHASLERTPDGCWLIDHGSRNGTYVNEERIDRRLLKPGDHIRIGQRIFKYLSPDHPETLYHEVVHQMMTSDWLTNVANRRYFDNSFQRELTRCRRHERPIAVLLLDLDHFKRINDLYGHLVGDDCLKEVSARVQGAIRADDLLGRIGGEEFAIVLSETKAADTQIVAERVRMRVEAQPFGLSRQLEISLTVSIGIAHSDEVSELTTEDLLTLADQRLYQAKHAGRNCICGPG